MENRKIPENPREIVFFILNEYFRKYCNLKVLINSYLDKSKLSGLNKNFVYNIYKGVIRNYLSLDFFISFFSNIKISKMDYEVLNILRIGFFQAIFLTKVPNYSIVNECVEISKKYGKPGTHGFINAVLRKMTSLEDVKNYYDEKISQIKEPDTRTGISCSFPDWIIKYWSGYYSGEKILKICTSLNKNPRTYFKINTLKTDRESIYSQISQEGFSLPEKYFESGSFAINNESGNVSCQELLKKGLIYAQDLSSQIAVRYFLEPKPNERILDVCSAPGGKAINASIIMGDKGEITAVENDIERAGLIRENINKMGINNIRVFEADASVEGFLETGFAGSTNSKIEPGLPPVKFDKIFIDAPCSAFGTASKNPDAKYNKNMGDIEVLSRNSLSILKNCDRYLKTGGRIVFYTCTLSWLENNAVIEKFLSLNKNRYHAGKTDTKKIFKDISQKSIKDFDETEQVFFEILPYYFDSEGATVCSITKIE